MLLCWLAVTAVARASDTPDPASVTVVGSLQSELGCPGDWQPECGSTGLAFSAEDRVWQGTFPIPSGSWEYKVALNGSWDENYGLNAQRNGANISLNLRAGDSVKFYYDHETHWMTDNRTSRIITAPGSYQSEIGCPGDWQPDCLRSWLQDPDGDGTFLLEARLPAGSYEAKAAVNESWNENYGAGGVQNGANLGFTVAQNDTPVVFRFVSSTNTLTIQVHQRYGDANADAIVNASDVARLLQVWGGLSGQVNLVLGDVAPVPATDFDGVGDGRIDIKDALRLMRHLNSPGSTWP